MGRIECELNVDCALAGLGSSVLDVLQMETETEIISSYSLDVDESRGDAKECLDELGLAEYVAFGPPMTLTDQVPQLIPFDLPPARSADRISRLAMMRFLIKRWSCSMMLFR